MGALRNVWRNLLRREGVEQDLDAELRATHDRLVEERLGAGMSLDEARRAADRELAPSR